MKKLLLYSYLMLGVWIYSYSQQSFLSDNFKGYVFYHGLSFYTPFVADSIAETIPIPSILQGKKIRKAYLIYGIRNQANLPSVWFNEFDLFINNYPAKISYKDRIGPWVNAYNGSQKCATHALDISDYPLNGSSIQVRKSVLFPQPFSEASLLILYEDTTQPFIHVEALYNKDDFYDSLEFIANTLPPIDNSKEVFLGAHAGYLCYKDDGYKVFVNNTRIGWIYNIGNCEGPFGDGYFSENQAIGLNGDNESLSMDSTDLISNIQTLLTGSDTFFSTVFKPVDTIYTPTDTFYNNLTNPSNAIWSLVTAYSPSCIPAASITENDTAICRGTTLNLNTSGATSCLWESNIPITNPTANSISVTPDSNTVIFCTMTDSNGCTSKQSVMVTVHQLPQANITASPSSCSNYNGVIGFQNVTGYGPFTYIVDGNTVGPLGAGNVPPGQHIAILQDGFGCQLVDTLITPAIQNWTGSFDINPITGTIPFTVDMINTSVGSNCQEWLWDGIFLSDSVFATQNINATGTYQVTLIACKDSVCFDTLTTTIEAGTEIVLTQLLSPNGDGKNDTYIVEYLPNNCQLTVFNRWGNEVYKSENYQNDWDGKWNGVLLPSSTYYVVLRLPDGTIMSNYIELIY